MIKEEKELTIEYLKRIQEGYVEGEGYDRYPLPEWHALNIAINALEQQPCDDCISRKAVIDVLTKTSGVRGDALKALYNLSTVTPTQKWIPVSERNPEEENKNYWICTNYGYQCECRWTNVNPFWTDLTTDWHWHHMDVPQYSKVVAWRQLPEPYKESEEE